MRGQEWAPLSGRRRSKPREASGVESGAWGRAGPLGVAPAHARHSHLRASLSSAPRARPLARVGGSRAFPPKFCGRASRPEQGRSEILAEGRADAEGSVGVTQTRVSPPDQPAQGRSGAVLSSSPSSGLPACLPVRASAERSQRNVWICLLHLLPLVFL